MMISWRRMIIALSCFGCFFVNSVRAEETPATETKKPDAKTEKVVEVKPALVTLREKYRNLENAPCNFDSIAKVGESLTYVLKWNGVPAGTSELQVKRKARLRGDEAMVFEMHTESNDFLSVLYPVDSTVKSFADVKTGKSHLFKRNLNEGRYHADDRVEFDYEHKNNAGEAEPTSTFSKTKDNKTKPSAPRPIPGALQDPLSFIYYLRQLDFDKVGQTRDILMGGRKGANIVTIEVKKFERRRFSGLGTFDCVVVEPRGDEDTESDNLVVAKGRATIWLEKNTRIPLMVSVDIPIGKATATLTREKNSALLQHAVDEKTPGLEVPADGN